MQSLKRLLYTWMTILPIGALAGSKNVIYLNTYLSDATVFTQGIELSTDGQIIISGGLYGESFIAYLDPQKGHLYKKQSLSEEYFSEGITQSPEGIWQLTWKEGLAFLREPEHLEVIATYPYEGEGWGLAYDPGQNLLWLSDGSSRLQKRKPNDFSIESYLDVHYKGKPLTQLNELEYANGYLYANVWYDNNIYKIDPRSGEVVNTYNIKPLLTKYLTFSQRRQINVLNGIAHIEGDRFYLTGKKYPYLFEVELIP